ncbi:sulfite exporter TauE/SafE family protein [Massilia yuzhufengensis]|uniref:Urease accessory protein UreH-like transmembrane domain-containing protein n=1 Tax=Massilia yuzhufengensis TaxID=1164594 RepID=A0A1I1QZA8_9BURK|nr:sulfite exporter TauE/SafE family protein [Massilia yuzhufengensis]SFD23370.1 hypothetical protein SAMN05216204_11995 [Massilia yuzhufengensis]
MSLSTHGIGLLPVFLVGLSGSVHCAGMCGGVVGALSMARTRPRGFPLPVRTVAMPVLSHPALFAAAYNGGRIASYAAAGALAGGAAGGAALLTGLPALQAGAYVLANLMLAALGLYLMDAWRGLALLERGGQALWRRVAPQLERLGPPATPARMFAAGLLWGWLPCGMVYSVLVTAMLSGSALGGASVMLAFGLGTLPMLAALGLAGARLRGWLGRRGVRQACGLLVLAFGLLGLYRAVAGLPAGWIDVLCLVPGANP